jgi:hypothetical protein
MHFSYTKQKIFLLASISLYIMIALFLNSLDSGTYKFDSKSSNINESIEDDNAATVYLQLKEFDSVSQTLKTRIWIYPPKEFATSGGSSVQLLYDARIYIDAAKWENEDAHGSFWYKYDFLRAIDVESDATNSIIDSRYNDKWFPFDRYSVPISGSIDFRIEGSETEDTKDDVWKIIPLKVQTYTSNLPGWSSKFSYQEDSEKQLTEDGLWALDIIMERTNLNKAILFLIGIIFIGGGISMLMLFRSILLLHRPPTLSGLVWSASTAFTMIQTRTVIPGSPRVGVKFDLFIFYPALAMAFISGGLMFYFWLTKETWSREM